MESSASASLGPARLSYAQNFEDLLLLRAFGAQPVGRYVSVGAGDPERYSATRVFYDRGWSGINIEPYPGFHAQLSAQRTRDVNLAVAVGAARGRGVLHVAQPPELSTLDATAAQQLFQRGQARGDLDVAVETLTDILERHAGDAPIDFMIIDVEGYEAEVLAGLDLERFRPRVLLIEATRPQSFEPNHSAWETRLLGARYRLALFDGLNRYYVRAEDEALVRCFTVPVGIADGFVAYELFKAFAEGQPLAAEIVDLRQRVATLSAAARRLEQRLAEAELNGSVSGRRSLATRLRPRLGILRQYSPRTWTPRPEYADEVAPVLRRASRSSRPFETRSGGSHARSKACSARAIPISNMSCATVVRPMVPSMS